MDYRAAWRADHKAGTPGKIVSDPDLRRRSPVGVTFLNKINDPLTKFHRKWLAHQ